MSVPNDLLIISFIIDRSWNFLVQVRIRNYYVPFDLRLDKRVCSHFYLGELSLKDAYEFKRLLGVSNDWWRWVWAKSIPPSKSFTVWRLLLSKLSTDGQLKHMNFAFPSRSGMIFGASATAVGRINVTSLCSQDCGSYLEAPPRDWIKINYDGASLGNPSSSACVDIARDFDDGFLDAFSNFLGVSNSLISKLSGAMLPFELAHENGWRKFG
ncbi:hypothetical protein KIW84_011556 [Lathyrus oleraceus]|uniref:Reverse transcriptase zinc-binding domain-containing protein n=1 Tax=Pisum sativum TaxID=3888 RepID=A0A9D5BFB2_PEA|nr:hypothetical protein KIW84_011556 [Pisum sativum]